MHTMKSVRFLAPITAFLVGMSVGAAPAFADENTDAGHEVEHYEGESIPNVEAARDTLRTMNDRLAALLAGDLSPADMDQIHRMSYTLENALQRLDTDVEGVAAKLEEMHLASERVDAAAVKRSGLAYLSRVDAVIKK